MQVIFFEIFMSGSGLWPVYLILMYLNFWTTNENILKGNKTSDKCVVDIFVDLIYHHHDHVLCINEVLKLKHLMTHNIETAAVYLNFLYI